jgi:hypothetical protein
MIFSFVINLINPVPLAIKTFYALFYLMKIRSVSLFLFNGKTCPFKKQPNKSPLVYQGFSLNTFLFSNRSR